MRELFSLTGYKSYLVNRDSSLVSRFFVMRPGQRFKTKDTRRRADDGRQKTDYRRQRTAICDTCLREYKFTIVDFISHSGERITYCICCHMDPVNGDFWFDFQSYK